MTENALFTNKEILDILSSYYEMQEYWGELTSQYDSEVAHYGDAGPGQRQAINDTEEILRSLKDQVEAINEMKCEIAPPPGYIIDYFDGKEQLFMIIDENFDSRFPF